MSPKEEEAAGGPGNPTSSSPQTKEEYLVREMAELKAKEQAILEEIAQKKKQLETLKAQLHAAESSEYFIFLI